MTDVEKILEGMRLMAEGCKEITDTCERCPFEPICANCDLAPHQWVEDADENEDPDYDCDWGYNEDMGFDAYEGCYTWDC